MSNKEHFVVKPIESSSQEDSIKLTVIGRGETPFTGSDVFIAEMESGVEVVAKFSNYPWGAKREWTGLNKLQEARIPVPKPLYIVQDEVGKKGVIVERINGEHLSFARIPDDGLKYQLGKVVHTMHSDTNISGEEWLASDKSDFSYYDKRQINWQKSGVPELSEQSVGSVLLHSLSDSIADELPTLVPVFNHNDLHDGQVLVTQNNDIIIIDVEMWSEDPSYNDIAYYLFHSIRTQRPEEDFVEFARGYSEESGFSETDKNFILYYLLYITMRGVYFFSEHRTKELPYAQLYLNQIINFINQEKIWKIL